MKRSDPRGSATIEAVLLAPIMMTLVMLIVHVHGQSDAAIRVARAADAGARAASMSAPGSMQAKGRRAAEQHLGSLAGLCTRTTVDVRRSLVVGLGAVTVTVTCTTNPRGLGLLGVGSRSIRRTSTEVVDVYRGT